MADTSASMTYSPGSGGNISDGGAGAGPPPVSFEQAMMAGQKKAAGAKQRLDQATQQAAQKVASFGEQRQALQPPPPPDVEPFKPPQPQDPSGLGEAFGAFALPLAIFGSLLTRQPLVNALNAGAQVMNAFHSADVERFNSAFKEWQAQTNYALKLHDYQMDFYKDALDKIREGKADALTDLEVRLKAMKDEAALEAYYTGGPDALMRFMQWRDTQAQKWPEVENNALKSKVQFEAGANWIKQHGHPPATPEEMEDYKKSIGEPTKTGNWVILNDPVKKDASGAPIQYRYQPNTGEATTLSGGPYTPGGAAKLGTAAQAGVGQFSDADVDYWANVLRSGGHFPPGLARTSAGSAFVQKVMQKMGHVGTPGDFIANAATVKADEHSLLNLTKMADAATSFERTANENFNTALKEAPKGIPTDWGPWLNKWIETGMTGAGDPNVPGYVAALLTAANEYSKIMSGSTGAQGSTVDSRREAAELFSPYLNKGQIERVIAIAQTDMSNREKSLYGQVDDIKSRLKNAGSGKSTIKQMDSGSAGAAKPDVIQNGWRYHWQDEKYEPAGQAH